MVPIDSRHHCNVHAATPYTTWWRFLDYSTATKRYYLLVLHTGEVRIRDLNITEADNLEHAAMPNLIYSYIGCSRVGLLIQCKEMWQMNKRMHLWKECRPQLPRGLRRRSAAARLLRSWVRIPPEARMFVCCECCVSSGSGLCDEPITRPEESYRLWCVVVRDHETSRMRRPWPALGRRTTGKKKKKPCEKSELYI